MADGWDADLIPIKVKPRKTGEVKEEESPRPNGEAPVEWTTPGWNQPEVRSDNTSDSAMLIDTEAVIKAIAVPEPAATVPELEVKEESRAR